MSAVQRRAGALNGVTQSAEKGAKAGYNAVKSLGLSNGQIAAVAVGIALALGMTILTLWFLCIPQTRKRNLSRNTTLHQDSMRSSVGLQQTVLGATITTQRTKRGASGQQAGLLSYDRPKLNSGSLAIPRGFGDYSLVQEVGTKAGTSECYDQGRSAYLDDDGTSLMSESTSMGDGPALPFMAASRKPSSTMMSGTPGQLRQPVRFSSTRTHPV